MVLGKWLICVLLHRLPGIPEKGLEIDSQSLAKFAENEKTLKEIENGLSAVKQKTVLELRSA